MGIARSGDFRAQEDGARDSMEEREDNTSSERDSKLRAQRTTKYTKYTHRTITQSQYYLLLALARLHFLTFLFHISKRGPNSNILLELAWSS